MELRVGNRYRLGRKIGSGSFGDIYLGEARRHRAPRGFAGRRAGSPAGRGLRRTGVDTRPLGIPAGRGPGHRSRPDTNGRCASAAGGLGAAGRGGVRGRAGVQAGLGGCRTVGAELGACPGPGRGRTRPRGRGQRASGRGGGVSEGVGKGQRAWAGGQRGGGGESRAGEGSGLGVGP